MVQATPDIWGVDTRSVTALRSRWWKAGQVFPPTRLPVVASHLPSRIVGSQSRSAPPWPFGVLDFVARAVVPAPGTVRATVGLPNASAQLVRAPGVPPADGNRRVVLYLHGGAFLTCGVNSHSRIAITLSKFADAPVLVVDYRLIPKHSIGMALDDCYDGYRWLRLRGYEPDQIVIAGDSAGGYLALSLTQRLQAEGEYPAALVALSPLLQLDQEQKQNHPNSHSDALFPHVPSMRWSRSSLERPPRTWSTASLKSSTSRSITSSPVCREP